MRWALLGPTPGSLPSSSMRSWTAPSYTGRAYDLRAAVSPDAPPPLPSASTGAPGRVAQMPTAAPVDSGGSSLKASARTCPLSAAMASMTSSVSRRRAFPAGRSAKDAG